MGVWQVCNPRKHIFLKPVLFYSIQESKTASQFAPQHRGTLSLVPWQCLLCPTPGPQLPPYPSHSIHQHPELQGSFSSWPSLCISQVHLSARFPPTPVPASYNIQQVIKFNDISCLPTLYPSLCQFVPVFKLLYSNPPYCGTFSWYEIWAVFTSRLFLVVNRVKIAILLCLSRHTFLFLCVDHINNYLHISGLGAYDFPCNTSALRTMQTEPRLCSELTSRK